MALFSRDDVRGLTLLLPILLVLALLVILYGKVRRSDVVEEMIGKDDTRTEESVSLTPFNPNTFSYEELRQAGVDAKVAVGIVRWREYGKVYRIREDLALVGGMTDSLYAVLKPYIIIDDSVAAKPLTYDFGEAGVERGYRRRDFRSDTIPLTQFRIDTATVAFLSHIGFSDRQAEVLVQYRDMIGGIFDEEQLRRCYVVSDTMAMRLLPHIIFSRVEEPVVEGPLEINGADTTALIKLYGIASLSARDIVEYRQRLGGFYSVEQISEVKSVTESNFEKILPQICCDSCKISKIDINFASPKLLEEHPYVSSRALRRIVKLRQLKGGWSRIEEMTSDEIFTAEEAERIAPYLRFAADSTR